MNVLAKSVAGRSPRADAAEHVTTVGSEALPGKRTNIVFLGRARNVLDKGLGEYVTTIGSEALTRKHQAIP